MMRGGALVGLFGVCVVACGDPEPLSWDEERIDLSGELCHGAALPIGWDEASPLGKSPSKAFALLGGACKADIAWSAPTASEVTVSPAAAMTEVSVKVDVDHGSARVVLAGDKQTSCAPQFSVGAHVRVTTKDGSFSEAADTRATYRWDELEALQFTTYADELGGKLKVLPEDARGRVSFGFKVQPVGDHCSGRIDVSPAGVDAIGGPSGVFASWSNTDCAGGENPVPLDTDASVPVSSRLAAAWSADISSGTWDDGTTTALILSLGDLPETACTVMGERQVRTVSVPVTYRTSDGRLTAHAARADVQVVQVGDDEPSLYLATDEHSACDTSASSLPYTPADCGGVSRVVIQLNLSTDHAGHSAGTILVLEYSKDADPSVSSPDATHTLIVE